MTPNPAAAYAERGWPVFPLEPGGKRPLGRLVPHGLHDATTDATTVARWWKAEPTANIGLRTGLHFDVLDIDGPDAEHRLDAAFTASGFDEYLIGPTVETPRGTHLYVAPTGHGNAVNLGGLTGVDWRGKGGYVVAPGSRKSDGTAWSWEIPDDPLYGPDADIRPAPPWLLTLLARPAAPHPSPTPSRAVVGDRYVQAAIERATGRLAVASEGERNHALNRESYGLGRLVGAKLVTAEQAGQALLAVALRIGLAEAEAVATIKSGLRSGIANPADRRVDR